MNYSENGDKADNMLRVIEKSECPDPKTISQIKTIRLAYIKLDVMSLMVKAYMLGFHNGRQDRN